MHDNHDFELDFARNSRTGISEVIYGAGKNSDQIIRILKEFKKNSTNCLVTRVSRKKAKIILQHLPNLKWNSIASTLVLNVITTEKQNGNCLIVSAGTSDLKVVSEVYETLSFFGFQGKIINDVGVAGIHRLYNRVEEFKEADVIIVVAGMEGALPPLVAGLTTAPVIGVPTSIGYGTALSGMTPLFAMLTSCAPGISIVNIDNGFGAATSAIKIMNKIHSHKSK